MKGNVMNEKAWWNSKARVAVQKSKLPGLGQRGKRAFMTAWSILGAVLLVVAMSVSVCGQSYPIQPI